MVQLRFLSGSLQHNSNDHGGGSLHHEVYREAREAIERLNSTRDYQDWVKVSDAMTVARTEAMKLSAKNKPEGRAYCQALSRILKREGLDVFDSATRNQASQNRRAPIRNRRLARGPRSLLNA